MKKILFLLSMFVFSEIALSSIFPSTWWGGSRDRVEEELPTEHTSDLIIQMELELSDKSDLELQCDDPRGNAFFTDRRKGFSNVTSVQDWCYGRFDLYGIERNLDNLFLHCNWDRFGGFGNYSWDATFVFIVQFYGNPQFHFSTFCGNGDYSGGSGNY